ncbi:MAG: long-chain-fatty-acid--CoA ligase [Bacteriovoracaceae bacterium]|jgi:long-chain acyl-CoA synthetase|nr:long-chain-fatty-acid--CoA ligase [Bacteriovoracaceae bacterium]
MNYPWLKSYPNGVPHEIDINEYSSINDILHQAFDKYKERPSFTCMGKEFTYGEIDSLSQKFASYLQNELKLSKGDRVALMMPNILQYPIALFGVLRAGMVAVNVNPLYTERELEHQLKDSGAETIIIFNNSCHILEKIYPNTPIKNIITTGIGDLLGFPKSLIVNFVIKNIKKMVPDWNLPGHIKFNDILAKGDESKFRPTEVSLSDTAFLQYTGGTTGVAKGAILSHGNIVANMLQARAWIKSSIEEGQETIITPLPLYHIFSLTANCFIFSSIGARNVLITNPRDIPGFVKELSKWDFSAITGVNTLFNALLNNEEFKQLDFSTLKLTLGGGMAVQKAVAQKWFQTTGKPLIEAYGLTETSPAACINPLDSKEFNGKIGLPICSTIVKILDDDENELPVGEAGELAIKGPQVMSGYWNRDLETKKVMTKDGFFKTGDIGTMDENGYFEIVDRKKDMILVSGFNVYPNEVEDAIAEHEGVLEAAAIGVPDEKSGEIVKLFVVKKDPNLTQEDIIAYCRSVLTGYKVPKIVEFREELPKSNVGKILRKDLRDEEKAANG